MPPPQHSSHTSKPSHTSETLFSLLRFTPEPSHPPSDKFISPLSNTPDPDSDRDKSAPQLDHSLALSIKTLLSKIESLSEAPKSKAPSNPALRTFLMVPTRNNWTPSFSSAQCILRHTLVSFQTRNHVYPALSYLHDIPLDWFQGKVCRAMDTGNLPDWFKSYPTFISELWRLFGSHDPVSDATEGLEALKFENSTGIARYTIDFNHHAFRTGWNDAALVRQYYKGLPDRLKDEIARIGKPTGLNPLQDLVSTLDARYWERHSEIHHNRSLTPSPPSPQSLTHSEASENSSTEDFPQNSAENVADDFAENCTENHAENSIDDLDEGCADNCTDSAENSAENLPETSPHPRLRFT